MTPKPQYKPTRKGGRPPKISDSDIEAIKSISDITNAEIAEQFGIKRSTVNRIRSGTYKRKGSYE